MNMVLIEENTMPHGFICKAIWNELSIFYKYVKVVIKDV